MSQGRASRLVCGWPSCKRPAELCYVLRTADGQPYQFHPLCRRCDKWAKVWVEQTAKTLGQLLGIGSLSMTTEQISPALTAQAFAVGPGATQTGRPSGSTKLPPPKRGRIWHD